MKRFVPFFACGILAISAGFAFAEPEPITDPFPDPIAPSDTAVDLKLIAEGLTTPVWLTAIPGAPGDRTGRLFVVDQPGQVYLIEEGKLSERPVLDVAGRMVALMEGFDERGLLGFTFHPGFADPVSPGHLKVYTYTSEPVPPEGADVRVDYRQPGGKVDHHSVVAEWKFASTTARTIDPATRREVLRFEQPAFNHDGGALIFGPDGMLYIGIGDGGSSHDRGEGHSPQGNGQDLTNILGTVVRIDPLGRSGRKVAGRFSVPSDNPFVGHDKALDVIWAYGMRNPYRMSFDERGRLIAADVGQNMIEEVNIIERGGNYGWRIKEGSFYFSAREGSAGQIYAEPIDGPVPDDLIDPVVEYDHDEGVSITGGFVYRGKAIPSLRGQYVFGDWRIRDQTGRGRLFHADLDTGEIRELFRAGGEPIGEFITGFGEDGDGEIYMLSTDEPGPKGRTGKVYRIVPAPR